MGVRLALREKEMTAYINGDIDDHSAREIREIIDDAAGKVRPEVLRLDFSDVPFMDSSGIGLIIGRYKLMRIWGGKLVLANMNPRLEMVFRLSGAEKLVETEKREKEESAI